MSAMKLSSRCLLLIFINVIVAFLLTNSPYIAGIAYAQDVQAEVSFAATGRAAGAIDIRSVTTPKASVITNSLDLVDMSDIPAPPAPPDERAFISMYFLIGAERYVQDARPPKAEHQFSLRVLLVNYESPVSTTLTWDVLRLPANYSARLTDMQTNNVIDLRAQQNYVFDLAPGPARNFSLVLSVTAPTPAPSATAAPVIAAQSPSPEATSIPASTPSPTATAAPATTSTPVPASAPAQTPVAIATPSPVLAPATTTASAATSTPGKVQQPSAPVSAPFPSASLPAASPAAENHLITPAPQKILPEPPPFVVAPPEFVPERTSIPALPEGQEKSSGRGLSTVLISVIAVAIAAIYVLSRFGRKRV